jgi:hypothetical protein
MNILSGQVWGMWELFADVGEKLSLVHTDTCLT